jgi:hypothetical protein
MAKPVEYQKEKRMGNVRSAPQPSEVYHSKGVEMLKKREQIQKLTSRLAATTGCRLKFTDHVSEHPLRKTLRIPKKSDGGQVI